MQGLKLTIPKAAGVAARRRIRSNEPSSVLAQLPSYIEHRAYSPGAKLPLERVLAAELKVGRPAVREAIKALSILEVLESRQGDGTYVKSLAGLYDDWPAAVEFSEKDLNMMEVLEVRKILEPKAAALAAARASEHQLREIAEAKAALDNQSIPWQQVGRLDLALHAAIFKVSGNSILDSVHRFLMPYLIKSQITACSAPPWACMQADHTAIVEAICCGESGAAEKAMLEHMHHIGLDLIPNRNR
jgi:DNA-binding FadR family transcriptional regulator